MFPSANLKYTTCLDDRLSLYNACPCPAMVFMTHPQWALCLVLRPDRTMTSRPDRSAETLFANPAQPTGVKATNQGACCPHLHMASQANSGHPAYLEAATSSLFLPGKKCPNKLPEPLWIFEPILSRCTCSYAKHLPVSWLLSSTCCAILPTHQDVLLWTPAGCYDNL